MSYVNEIVVMCIPYATVWASSRYVKLWVAHAPGMPGTLSPPPRVAIPTCITARARYTCRDACRDR